MTKYHIKKNGTPGVCTAELSACPLGGKDAHFDTLEAAQNAAQEKLESNFGFFKQLGDKVLGPKHGKHDERQRH